jgi:hypothetical protein
MRNFASKLIVSVVLSLGFQMFGAEAQLSSPGAEQISVGLSSTGQRTAPDGESGEPVVPPKGEFVIFASKATNLTNLFDSTTSNTANIYRYSPTGEIELMSLNIESKPPAKANAEDLIFGCRSPAVSRISADGSYAVAFLSDAPDLVTGYSQSQEGGGITQIFLRLPKLNQTVLITRIVDATTNISADQSSDQPTVALIRENPNLYQVCFHSTATNLVANQDQTQQNAIYCREYDEVAGLSNTIRIRGVSTSEEMRQPILSSDGQTLLLVSNGNLIDGKAANEFSQVYRYLFSSGQLNLVTSNASGAPAVGNSDSPSITHNGSTVFFRYDGESVTQGQVPDLLGFERVTKAVLVKQEISTGQNLQVNINAAGNPSDASVVSGRVDATGKFAVFSDRGTNLTSGGISDKAQVYVKDLETGEIVRTSINGAGQAGDDDSGANAGTNFYPHLAIGSRDDAKASPFVAFMSFAPNLASFGSPSSVLPFVFRAQVNLPNPTPTPTPTPSPTSTPQTFKNGIRITEPPDIEVLDKRSDGRYDIRVICEKFRLGSRIFENIQEIIDILASKKARLSYQVEIQKAGSKTRITRVSSRNIVAVRKLDPGRYTVRYRIVATQGNKKAQSRLSPKATITLS